MDLKLIKTMIVASLCTFTAGCSGSGENAVNEPKEVKTIEEQMQEHETRAEEEAAQLKEQAQYN
ncbi:hypothetical protein [Allorhodopirellula heiligendammensis]|uniref:Uncharacterized protein n=1 Tax=Allorhodopirellula heiligendammensis TaxID=2714739 RepID=A0A5C6C3Y8_9BACT|nr:hypothetical protein [Allorhodopirellula heiligendammensis]TWU18802.1 hypothetical protein Poly21_09680 [Allorhodopirellula heiligendammensis]|tara:strand:- start:65 stop:256 length:192 start_codon:yes stop_codon:yes gene_type:complete